MEEYNVMVIEMGKNSDAVSDNDYSSDSKAQLQLNFHTHTKKMYQYIQKYSNVVVRAWGRLPLRQYLEQFFKIGSSCVFQGIFRPAFRPNIYDV